MKGQSYKLGSQSRHPLDHVLNILFRRRDVEVAEGKVVSVSLAENTTADAALGRCAVDRVAAWPYPDAVSGQLHLPFTLSTTRR